MTPQLGLGLATTCIDVSRLVRFTAMPPGDTQRWRVTGSGARWRGRVGTNIGVLEIVNARAHGILLDFGGGEIAAFHPMDMLPAGSGE